MCDKYFGVLYLALIQGKRKTKQYKYISYALYYLSYVTRITTTHELTHAHPGYVMGLELLTDISETFSTTLYFLDTKVIVRFSNKALRDVCEKLIHRSPKRSQ